MKDLFIANGDAARSIQPVKVVATYDFHHATGVLIYQAVRYEPKTFSQRRLDGHGGWIGNLKGVPPLLYRLPVNDPRRDHDNVAQL
jgi:hypothetical protein